MAERDFGSVPITTPREQSCVPRRMQSTDTACCFTPAGAPPDQPDLAIYSQEEQFTLGIAPSWDNPDILTSLSNPLRLLPESIVTVRNLSLTASAVNGQVLFSLSAFGIGQPRALLASQFVTLAPSQQISLSFPLPQAIVHAAEQRIAVSVRLVHPYDGNDLNNTGSQLIDEAFTSKLGRNFSLTFPVVNPSSAAQQISLVVLPNQLSASVSPSSYSLAPLEQIMATLQISVPGALHGTSAAALRSDVTIVGRDGSGKLVNGLTYLVWVDD